MSILLVRHADAGNRSGWGGPDHLRPLSDKGRAQSLGLLSLAERHSIDVLLSSRYLRCLDTLTPMASVLELGIEVEGTLTEGADPKDATERVRDLAEAGISAVLSSHGDIIPGILETLAADGLDIGLEPACQKGSAWLLTFTGRKPATATYVPPRLAGPG